MLYQWSNTLIKCRTETDHCQIRTKNEFVTVAVVSGLFTFFRRFLLYFFFEDCLTPQFRILRGVGRSTVEIISEGCAVDCWLNFKDLSSSTLCFFHFFFEHITTKQFFCCSQKLLESEGEEKKNVFLSSICVFLLNSSLIYLSSTFFFSINFAIYNAICSKFFGNSNP